MMLSWVQMDSQSHTSLLIDRLLSIILRERLLPIFLLGQDKRFLVWLLRRAMLCSLQPWEVQQRFLLSPLRHVLPPSSTKIPNVFAQEMLPFKQVHANADQILWVTSRIPPVAVLPLFSSKTESAMSVVEIWLLWLIPVNASQAISSTVKACLANALPLHSMRMINVRASMATSPVTPVQSVPSFAQEDALQISFLAALFQQFSTL